MTGRAERAVVFFCDRDDDDGSRAGQLKNYLPM